MLNFEYRLPTRIVFGKGMEEQAGEEIKKSGGTKVLVHYGGHSAEKTGLLAKVCRILEESQLPYVLLGGVKPNPRLSKIYEGIALAKKENVDFI